MVKGKKLTGFESPRAIARTTTYARLTILFSPDSHIPFPNTPDIWSLQFVLKLPALSAGLLVSAKIVLELMAGTILTQSLSWAKALAPLKESYRRNVY